MATEPPSGSGSIDVHAPADPIVAIIERAGMVPDSRVQRCTAAAAAAHQQRFANGKADDPALNRSTLLWALWRTDDTVRSALEQSGARFEAFVSMLEIRGDPEPLTGPFDLGAGLTRALQFFSPPPPEAGSTVTPALLGVAVLEDVVSNGGLLRDRLRRSGADPAAVLDALRRLMTGNADGTDDTGGPVDEPLVRVRDLSPRRFGVDLPPERDRPGPYVARDADRELDRLLGEHPPVVAVVAPPLSGAVRAIFEALRRVRPDEHVLLMHELQEVGGTSRIGAEDLERLGSGAGLVWVRNLRRLLDSSPVFPEWFAQRSGDLAATIVVLLRPEDTSRATELGLLSGPLVEMSGQLSEDERTRARSAYGKVLSTVAEIAEAALVGQGVLRATYAADSATAAALLDERSDDLDIRADVDMLAKLIASKEMRPPLSIGLFGPWGSGKSFLMRQVQLRIADLTDRSRDLPGGSTGYLSEIVPVEFNAWQYAHGSALWASLINRVFEGIQTKLKGDDRYQRVLRNIAAKNAGVLQAQERLEAARTKVEERRDAAGDRAIQEVADGHDEISDEATTTLAETLDLDATKNQVSDLRNEVAALASTTARMRKGWSTASPARKALVVSALIAGVVFFGVLAFVPSAVEPMAAALAAVGSILTAVTQVLRPVNQGLSHAATLLRADDADKDALQHAQDDLDEATEQLAAAKASGLAGLYGFVSDRSAAEEYRRHLGMAPMIRDDLKRLAEMSQKADGLPGIERIVIFIDDLDRCPAAEVVRVLEAVNLLFGFELFVVVVAVDSRWLLRSLEGTFSEAFADDEGNAPTPQNYLEKIIQIPFWLRPMQPHGFERLVTTLAGEVDGARGARQASEGDGPGPDIEPAPATPWLGPHPLPVDDGDGDGQGVGDGDPSTGTPVVRVAEQEEETAEERKEDLNPQALRLTQDERDFMLQFLPLVRTPRAVKRFLNTYQLLRVSVDDVETFVRGCEYQPVLILLALMTGTTPITDTMIDGLRSMTETSFEDFLERAAGEKSAAEKSAAGGSAAGQAQPDRGPTEAWRQVFTACNALPTATLTPSVIEDWLPKVARYSFHPIEV